jgi:hypothetical protein
MPPESTSRVTTRAQNAETHPGALAKRKRRTKAEIEADNKKAEEAKAAKQAKKTAGLKKIADLEEKIEEDDANDATPRPKFPRGKIPLRRTSSHLLIPLYDDNYSEPLTEDLNNASDEYNPPTDAPDATDVEEEPAKKRVKEPKTKEPKPKVRDAINAARKESTNVTQGGVEERQKGPGSMVDKPASAHGKKAHEAARFVITLDPMTSA